MSNQFGFVSEDAFMEKMDTQNALLAAIARSNIDLADINWAKLENYANQGVFGNLFDFGDQFTDIWKDTVASKEYSVPWQLNHIGTVTLEDGEELAKRPFLQTHFAHPFGVQFSHQRAFLACPDGIPAGTGMYFSFGASWGGNCVKGAVVRFATTIDIPAGGKISGCYGAPDTNIANWKIYTHSADGKTVLETIIPTFEIVEGDADLGTMNLNTRNGNLNSMQEMAYGWNRWKYSALRQYLNSDKGVGEWWTAQDEWDIAPDQLTTKAGFLSGCPEDFINAVKTVKVTTYTNTVQDGGGEDITYDKVFIPSLEEMYIAPQIAGEGERHEYWMRRSGETSPVKQYGTYPNYIHYAVENHSSPQSVRLRSASRGLACYAWCVVASGYVSSYSAASAASRFAPLVVL